MKVYSRPEVLEDHIAPAALTIISILGDGSNTTVPSSNGQFNSVDNILNNTGAVPGSFHGDILAVTSLGLGATPGSPELPSQTIDFSEFRIRTVRVGIDSLLGEAVIEPQDAALQSLIGTTAVDSVLTDPGASLLAEELSVSNDVIEAISSAVGEDRSTVLVGLSSDEFERAGGSAFLTSL